MANYSELLKDPRWQKKRLQIFERDNWTCQYCLSTDKTLNVHHMRYEGMPWEAKDEWLVTFCCDCHDFEEELCGANPMLKTIAYHAGIPALFQIEVISRTVWYKGIKEAQEIINKLDQEHPDKIFIKRNKEVSNG